MIGGRLVGLDARLSLLSFEAGDLVTQKLYLLFKEMDLLQVTLNEVEQGEDALSDIGILYRDPLFDWGRSLRA